MSVQQTSYCPTQEYVEMFPWADGTPFDWDKTAADGKLDQMFLTGKSSSCSPSPTYFTGIFTSSLIAELCHL